MGTPTGSPATSDWPPARTSPCTAATSVEVPPMSKERIFRNPRRRLQRRDPAARLHDKDARDEDSRLASLPRRAGAISRFFSVLFGALCQSFHVALHERL